MPEFQHIELFLDSTYSSVEQKRFIFASRCICNFVERAISNAGFQSPYSRLNIHCTKNPHLVRVLPLKNEPYLEVCIALDLVPLESLSPEAIQKQFAKVIANGMRAARTVAPVPDEECLQALNDFQANGFKNRWVYLDKNWAKWKCRCIISAELTMDAFELEQAIYRNGELIASHRIAQTKPREGLFVDYLGDLSMGAEGIITYKRRAKVLSVFVLQSGVFSDSPPSTPRG